MHIHQRWRFHNLSTLENFTVSRKYMHKWSTHANTLEHTHFCLKNDTNTFLKTENTPYRQTQSTNVYVCKHTRTHITLMFKRCPYMMYIYVYTCVRVLVFVICVARKSIRKFTFDTKWEDVRAVHRSAFFNFLRSKGGALEQEAGSLCVPRLWHTCGYNYHSPIS